MPTPTSLVNPALFLATNSTPILAIKSPMLAGKVALKAVNMMVSTAPLTAEQVKVPIARSVPSDRDTFLTVDRRSRFYVPRYQIQETQGSNGPAYAMAFEQGLDGRWGLRITLESAPPAGQSNQSRPLEHDLRVTLSFHPGGDQTRNRKTLQFQDRIIVGDDTQVTLWLDSLPERDEVYHAITNPTYLTTVTLQRRAQLAVANTQEVTESFEESALGNNNLFLSKADLSKTLLRTDLSKFRRRTPQQELPQPKLELLEMRHGRISGGTLSEYYFAISNWKEFPKDQFEIIKFRDGTKERKGPRLNFQLYDAVSGKPLQSYANFEDPEQLSKIHFETKSKEAPIQQVLIIVEDRKTGATQKSEPLLLERPEPPQKTFTLHWFDFETALSPYPFLFDPNLHSHIFAALAGPPPRPASEGLVRHRETFDGTVHSYFQDDVALHRIYYVPDDFRIARHSGPFRPPLVTVRVQSNGDDTADSEVSFNYVMSPHTKNERLINAAQKIAVATGQNIEDLEFQPYLSSDISFVVTRPTAVGRIPEERSTSPLMLQQAVSDTLVMTVTDFQIMFDAMIGQTASALSGVVSIGIDGWDTEVRPFVAEFAQLAGDTMDLSVVTTSDTTATLTLTNAIESPLEFAGTRVSANRDGASLEVSGLSTVIEQMGPSDVIAPPVSFAGLPGTGAVTMSLIESGPVTPDPAAIMDTILDRSSLEYFRQIEVRSLPTYYLTPASGLATDTIAAILIEFDGGETITLTDQMIIAFARIDFPFSQVILRELDDDGTYTYRKTIIYADGRQVTDTEPTTGSASLFFVTPTVNLS